MADERVAYDLTANEARQVEAFREAARRLTGTAPAVGVYVRRLNYGPYPWSDPTVEVDGNGYGAGSTVRGALSWALWCVAEKAAVAQYQRAEEHDRMRFEAEAEVERLRREVETLTSKLDLIADDKRADADHLRGLARACAEAARLRAAGKCDLCERPAPCGCSYAASSEAIEARVLEGGEAE